VLRDHRLLTLLGGALLVLWGVWWGVSLPAGRLFFAEHLWFRFPALGSDFWTQSDYAARLWAGGVDPYADEHHLFHYPPIVIRLFLWTPLLSPVVALRVWIVVLAALLVLGSLAASRARRALGSGELPATLALALVLLGFPGVFTMERANFDLIVLAALLLAVEISRRGESSPRAAAWAELLAGGVLAVGPWVKLYPGLMAVGLVATRRFRMLAGFVVAGVGIGCLAPDETLQSFHVLGLAMNLARTLAAGEPFPPWSHSLSLAWTKLGEATAGTSLGALVGSIPASAFGAAVIAPLLAWVCLRVWRSRKSGPLLYPLLAWICAVASSVPVIANDYSLIFLPLAAVAASSVRDPLVVRVALALLALWWQPFWLPVPGLLMLAVKLAGLVAVGVSITRRAAELDPAAARG
jgi:hypothetical protein